ncbi:conjugal transfer protein TrbD [Escherichia coli]|nr:conjugal transfer protein TrbD [Escherichia coli]
MKEQSEIMEIKMNRRNINIIKSSPESLPHNFNMAAVGVMKKGMSMRLFSSPGHIVVAGQSGGGKSVPAKELIDRIIQKYKEPFDE